MAETSLTQGTAAAMQRDSDASLAKVLRAHPGAQLDAAVESKDAVDSTDGTGMGEAVPLALPTADAATASMAKCRE